MSVNRKKVYFPVKNEHVDDRLLLGSFSSWTTNNRTLFFFFFCHTNRPGFLWWHSDISTAYKYNIMSTFFNCGKYDVKNLWYIFYGRVMTKKQTFSWNTVKTFSVSSRFPIPFYLQMCTGAVTFLGSQASSSTTCHHSFSVLFSVFQCKIVKLLLEQLGVDIRRSEKRLYYMARNVIFFLPFNGFSANGPSLPSHNFNDHFLYHTEIF